jgi:hypothetical protein
VNICNLKILAKSEFQRFSSQGVKVWVKSNRGVVGQNISSGGMSAIYGRSLYFFVGSVYALLCQPFTRAIIWGIDKA